MSPSDDRSRSRRDRGAEPARRGKRQPAGIERAKRTPGAPPRRPVPKVEKVPKPELPKDESPELPNAVLREIRKAVQNDHELAAEVSLALSIASEALDLGEADVAVRYAAWAKSVVPRSPSIREALGVGLYLSEEYGPALAELQAYRRLSGREDQNHLVADCIRATDPDTARIADLVEAMRTADHVPLDRAIEGTIVWASAVADTGDVGAARAIVRRHLESLGRVDAPDEAHLRLWYVAGDLADRAGDTREARDWFTRVAGEDDEFFDVEDRLARL